MSEATTTANTTNQQRQQPDPPGGLYDQFLGRMRARFAPLSGALFTTDAQGVFDAYLGALPEGERQHYTCSSCRAFVRRYGGLARIAELEANLDRLGCPEMGGERVNMKAMNTQVLVDKAVKHLEAIKARGDRCRCDIGYPGGCGCGSWMRNEAEDALEELTKA